MSVLDLENMTRAKAEALIRRLEAARGWAQHESNGWGLSPVGGFRPADTCWIRAMRDYAHAPPGWTLDDELARFAGWLAERGWRLDRVSTDHPMHFRLVPGPVEVASGKDGAS